MAAHRWGIGFSLRYQPLACVLAALAVGIVADRYVESPAEVVRTRQKVNVTVLSVDLERRRIALSMKSRPPVEE